MTNVVGFKGRLAAFAIAFVAGVVLGTVVQTQFNLLALQQLGVEIGAGVRLSTTVDDLRQFGPFYAAVFGVSFMLSTLVTGLLLKVLGLGHRALFHAFGAAVALWVTFTLVDALTPPPTLIAATRTLAGVGALLMTAACAGGLYARLTALRGLPRAGYNTFAALALVTGLAVPVDELRAQPAASYQVQEVVAGLEHPWSLAFLPDGGALVTERPGRLRRITAAGELVPGEVSGLPKVFSSGQAGLFEVLISEDFASSGLVFLSYACGVESANHLCVARAKLGEDRLENVEEIFRALPGKKGDAHYGGRMAQLPDASLIITLGDGFDYREQAQILGNHLGSIVRIGTDGVAPEDNPFIDSPDARPEVFSYGHRNVQGLVYDPVEQLLISHEHGPRGGDEINVLRPGQNYGWPVITYGLDYTGARITPFTEYPNMEQPLLQWTPSFAPSGMTRYRGELFPEWRGDLFVGALADRSVRRVEFVDGEAEDVETLFKELKARIRDVITGPDGALYLLTDESDGRVLRVSPKR